MMSTKDFCFFVKGNMLRLKQEGDGNPFILPSTRNNFITYYWVTIMFVFSQLL